MEVVFLLAVLLSFVSILTILARPQLVIGVQLFGTSILAMGYTQLGIEPQVANTILALTILALGIYFLRGSKARWMPTSPIEIAMGCLVLYMALTLTFTDCPNYGRQKLLRIAGIGLACLYVARVFASSPERLRETFSLLGYYSVAVITIFFLFVMISTNINSRLRSEFFNPLSLAYGSVGMIGLTTYLFLRNRGGAIRLFALATILMAVIIIVGSGTRGAVLALIVATTCTFLRGKQLVKTLIVMTSVISLVITVVIFFGSESGIERLLGQDETGYRSGEGRLELYQDGIEQFAAHPIFGQGVGSYAWHIVKIDTKLYPHNSVIEIAGEEGLIGLTLYGIVLFLCMQQIWRIRKHVQPGHEYFIELSVVQFLFYAGFINSCLSFDFGAQRLLMAAFGLLGGISHWKSLKDEGKQRRYVVKPQPQMQELPPVYVPR